MERIEARVSTSETPPDVTQQVVGEPSLAEAMTMISADKTLSASKRRHWLTSMNRIAEGIGRPAASLPARLTALRQPVHRLNAARMRIDGKTLSNHKSNLRAALLHLAKVANIPTRGARLSPDWSRLMSAIPMTKSRLLLSGIMRYCSARLLRPEDMSMEIVEGYFEFRASTSFLETGIARQRELIRAWNDCADRVPGWPDCRLPLPNLPAISKGPEWAQFPPGLRQDIENYLLHLAKAHRSMGGKRRRPCKPSTISTRRRELMAFARKAVAMGTPIEELSSFSALLRPEVVRATLEGYWGNSDQPSRYVIDLARKLLSVARHTANLSPQAIEELDDIWHSLEEHRGGTLTENALKVIRAVLTTDLWTKVCRLPELMMKEAEQLHNRSPKKAAARAVLAIQILILTRAPVRVGNLLGIRLDRNLTRPGGAKRPFLLQYPGYDVKNRVDLAFPLSPTSTALIDRYIRIFRPHLADHKHDWLFPAADNKPRSAKEASAAIAKRLERETGLRITAHKFRHAAAAIILRKHPGNYEYVRRVLGHLNIATTIRFYTALESFAAAESFGELIEERLNEQEGEA